MAKRKVIEEAAAEPELVEVKSIQDSISELPAPAEVSGGFEPIENIGITRGGRRVKNVVSYPSGITVETY